MKEEMKHFEVGYIFPSINLSKLKSLQILVISLKLTYEYIFLKVKHFSWAAPCKKGPDQSMCYGDVFSSNSGIFFPHFFV